MSAPRADTSARPIGRASAGEPIVTDTPTEGIDLILDLLLRHTLQHQLADISKPLAEAFFALQSRMDGLAPDTASHSRSTLHMTLESCYHLSAALELDDVAADVRRAMDKMVRHAGMAAP